MVNIGNIGFCLLALVACAYCDKTLNNRPIIGVIAETTRGAQTKYGYSFIAACYVKLMESAGARVVPVLLNQPSQYYDKMFNSLNGFLIPGGGQNLSHSPYQEITSKFLNKSTEAFNKNGTIFPVWGICLGFEMLNVWAAKNIDVLERCHAEDMALPLDLKTPNNYKNSRIFGNMTKKLLDIFETKDVTVNYHGKCVTPSKFKKYNVGKILKPLSYNKDMKGETFISTVEGVKAPIYGTQWHPEKNLFVFTKAKSHAKTPHGQDAILAAQYMANFFVNQARKNLNKFASTMEEERYLIYNYDPVYVGKDGNFYEQMYIFPKDAHQGTTVKPETTTKKGGNGGETKTAGFITIIFAMLICIIPKC